MTNEDDWNTDEPTFFKPFEQGQTVTGVNLGETSSQYDTPAYEIRLTEDQEIPVDEDETVEMEEGQTVSISYMAVSEFMGDHEGDMVRIEYTGEAVSDTSGRSYKTFEKKWKEAEE